VEALPRFTLVGTLLSGAPLLVLRRYFCLPVFRFPLWVSPILDCTTSIRGPAYHGLGRVWLLFQARIPCKVAPTLFSLVGLAPSAIFLPS